MKCKKCKTLKGNELAVHRFSTHGLSWVVQRIEPTPELLALWEEHKATGKEGSFKHKFG